MFQLMTEKGNHVKTRRKLETLWVEHDQLKVDLRQKLQELEVAMAQQGKYVQQQCVGELWKFRGSVKGH